MFSICEYGIDVINYVIDLIILVLEYIVMSISTSKKCEHPLELQSM